ncbi:MAG TPA: SCO family protein [Candidatus Cybelea sp.]|nr:SCO family protein [Candidatus Cybelea sp.]
MKRRLGTLLVVMAAISAAVLGYLYFAMNNAGAPLAGGAIGGPIHLTAADGTVFDSASLKGKPYAVYFGFTHCPEACPTTLSEISRTTEQIGAPAKDFITLFITIDPERDTPALMKDYVSNFTGNIIGLTGTPDEVASVAKEFRVYYKKVPTSDGSYTMDHTAVVYLMDRNGTFDSVIPYSDGHDAYVEKIKNLLAR